MLANLFAKTTEKEVSKSTFKEYSDNIDKDDKTPYLQKEETTETFSVKAPSNTFSWNNYDMSDNGLRQMSFEDINSCVDNLEDVIKEETLIMPNTFGPFGNITGLYSVKFIKSNDWKYYTGEFLNGLFHGVGKFIGHKKSHIGTFINGRFVKGYLNANNITFQGYFCDNTTVNKDCKYSVDNIPFKFENLEGFCNKKLEDEMATVTLPGNIEVKIILGLKQNNIYVTGVGEIKFDNGCMVTGKHTTCNFRNINQPLTFSEGFYLKDHFVIPENFQPSNILKFGVTAYKYYLLTNFDFPSTFYKKYHKKQLTDEQLLDLEEKDYKELGLTDDNIKQLKGKFEKMFANKEFRKLPMSDIKSNGEFDKTGKLIRGYEFRCRPDLSILAGYFDHGQLVRWGRCYEKVREVTADMTGYVTSAINRKNNRVDPYIMCGFVENGILQGYAEVEVKTDKEFYSYDGEYLDGLFHGKGYLRKAVKGNDNTHCHTSFGIFKKGVLESGQKDISVTV